MSTTRRVAAPLLCVRNHHAADCDRPPHIDDRGPSRYLGYFENQHGEQAVFVYDHDTRQAFISMGDAGWDVPYVVIDGTVPDLVFLRLSGCGCAHAGKPPLRMQRRCKRD